MILGTILSLILITIGAITFYRDASRTEFPLSPLLLYLIGIMLACTITIIQDKETNKTKSINNSIIKSNYNYKYNTFNIMYTKNNDTLALDDIYPYELDSIVNSLNK